MIVLVCGSREWTNRALMQRVLASELDALDPHLQHDIEVIHGGCRGADLMCADILRNSIYKVRAMPADWERHGKAAGPMRNLAMLDEGPVLVLAFMRGESKGTRHTIEQAQRRSIPTVLTKAEDAA